MHPPARHAPRAPQPDQSPAQADPAGTAALHQAGSGSARTPGDRVKARPGGAGGTWEVLAPLILAREESRTGKRLDINPASASHPVGTRPWGLPGPDPTPGPFAWAGGATEQGGSAGKGGVWQELRLCLWQAGTAAGPPSPTGAYLLGEGGGNVLTASASGEGLRSGQNRLGWKTAPQPRPEQQRRRGGSWEGERGPPGPRYGPPPAPGTALAFPR